MFSQSLIRRNNRTNEKIPVKPKAKPTNKLKIVDEAMNSNLSPYDVCVSSSVFQLNAFGAANVVVNTIIMETAAPTSAAT